MSGDEPPRRTTLLLVDDDDALRRRLARALESRGLEVHGAANAREARLSLAITAPDHAIVDLRLPDGSGLELVRELRATDETRRILVFTGFGTIPLAVEAMRAGADHVLTKPADVDELLKAFGLADGEVTTVPTLEAVADEHVDRVLATVDGNLTHAADALGIHRRSLQRWLARRRGP